MEQRAEDEVEALRQEVSELKGVAAELVTRLLQINSALADRRMPVQLREPHEADALPLEALRSLRG